ncbi:hypothetical protein ACJX0J_026932, partial [Zea mays]
YFFKTYGVDPKPHVNLMRKESDHYKTSNGPGLIMRLRSPRINKTICIFHWLEFGRRKGIILKRRKGQKLE